MPDIKDFKQKARQLRIDILETIANAGSGHPGGSLSCVEILISLYFYKLRPGLKTPRGPTGTGL